MTQWSSPEQAERFVKSYAGAILRLCLTYSLSREDAQDVCQDLFLKLLEEGRSFDSQEHEKAFILRAAINACKDLRKSARWKRVRPLEEAVPLHTAPTEDCGLSDAVRELPIHYGAVVYLFYYEGYNLEEIAQICGCSPVAARKRLSRARKLLAKRLEVAL
ncbi:MAG: RNA polymerase sigma factor [Lawsonibacter sp.]|jgi:RNA polymerase sigma factor (sigma-70 family)